MMRHSSRTGTRRMGANRFNFAEDEVRSPPPTHVWMTRAVIVACFVGGAAAVHILMGYSFHWQFW
jgi:hypothetical protein